MQAQLATRGVTVVADERLAAMCALYKDRCSSTVELADWLQMYFAPVSAPADELASHLTDAVRAALVALRGRLADAVWDKPGIAQSIKETLAGHRLKMPQLALPLRLLLCGRSQTPSVDAVVALFDRPTVLTRLQHL